VTLIPGFTDGIRDFVLRIEGLEDGMCDLHTRVVGIEQAVGLLLQHFSLQGQAPYVNPSSGHQ